MNYNSASQRLSWVAAVNLVVGILFFLIGLIVIGINSNRWDPDWSAVGTGVLLAYVGGGFFSIGFFASLLLLTAQSVVEGVTRALRSSLGGANSTSGSDRPLMREPATGKTYARPAATTVRQSEPAFKDQSDEAQYIRNPDAWAQRNLSSSNYEWWTEMGRPNLMRWVNEGRPDFKEWIKGNKN